jgi:uncharacterized protein
MRLLLTMSLLTLIATWDRAQAQELPTKNTIPTVTVRGDGVARRKPDFAHVIVSVATTAASLKDAADRQRQSAARALALLQSLKGQGLEVERSDYTLDETTPDPGASTGTAPQFTAQTSFTLKVDALDKLDADLSILVDSGLIQVGSSSFEVADPASALDDARRAAIAAARKSAQAYADAGDFKLLQLETVVDATSQSFSELSAPVFAARASAGSVALIPPANLSFRASVQATWRIAPR